MDSHLLTEFAGIALSTFVGAYAAFGLQTRREEAKARATRAAVARALIADLRALEPVLLQLYRHDRAGSWQGKRLALFYDGLRAEVTTFPPPTVYPVSEVFRIADDLFGLVVQNRAAAQPNRSDAFHHTVRTKAGLRSKRFPPPRQP